MNPNKGIHINNIMKSMNLFIIYNIINKEFFQFRFKEGDEQEIVENVKKIR
jgi:hypothetical protein